MLARERAQATFFLIDHHITDETAHIVRRIVDAAVLPELLGRETFQDWGEEEIKLTLSEVYRVATEVNAVHAAGFFMPGMFIPGMFMSEMTRCTGWAASLPSAVPTFTLYRIRTPIDTIEIAETGETAMKSILRIFK